MMKLSFCIFLLVCVQICLAQQFKTILGTKNIIEGEPFQVQYVLENMLKEDKFFQPEFKPLYYVSGPNVYTGSAYSSEGPVRLSNIVFTLLAPAKGRYKIPGAIATINGVRVTSLDIPVEVISREEANKLGLTSQRPINSDGYYLAPGEDANKKIKENLFVKLSVDRRSCFVGQPITATFKLYSRLESKSDVIKSPGFYGFAIQDMISLEDNLNTIEVIKGKKFEVHTIRKVQLYPISAGTLNIDPMEIENTVEFSKKPDTHQPSQELREGVLAKKLPDNNPAKLVVETTMHTEPIGIEVKSLPTVKQPENFSGALGQFKIEASLNKYKIAKNEEAILLLKISGKGNFTQLVAPDIIWPKNLDSFEVEAVDSLNNKITPMTGYRLFKFPFQVAAPGKYTIPSVKFSFFDPDSNSYKTISSAPLELTASDSIAIIKNKKQNQIGANKKTESMTMIWVFALVIGVIILAAIFVLKKKPVKKKVDPIVKHDIDTEKYLKGASDLVFSNERLFYITLRRGIWEFLTDQFQISGSTMSKQTLTDKLTSIGIKTETQAELHKLLEICEAGTFTNFTIGHNREGVLIDSKKILESLAAQKPA